MHGNGTFGVEWRWPEWSNRRSWYTVADMGNDRFEISYPIGNRSNTYDGSKAEIDKIVEAIEAA